MTMGPAGNDRLRFARTLTNRTISGLEGCPANGSAVANRMISLPPQIITWVSNGNRRIISARSFVRLIVLRITKVPAAPMLTASKRTSAFARTLGRNVR
jgi:hypothetical protein